MCFLKMIQTYWITCPEGPVCTCHAPLPSFPWYLMKRRHRKCVKSSELKRQVTSSNLACHISQFPKQRSVVTTRLYRIWKGSYRNPYGNPTGNRAFPVAKTIEKTGYWSGSWCQERQELCAKLGGCCDTGRGENLSESSAGQMQRRSQMQKATEEAMALRLVTDLKWKLGRGRHSGWCPDFQVGKRWWGRSWEKNSGLKRWVQISPC